MGLDFVELIMAVEKGFQIRIENQEAGELSTVGELYQLVVSKLEVRNSQMNRTRLVDSVGGWNEKEVWDALRRIIMRETGVEREQITPDARFVEDLGLD